MENNQTKKYPVERGSQSELREIYIEDPVEIIFSESSCEVTAKSIALNGAVIQEASIAAENPQHSNGREGG